MGASASLPKKLSGLSIECVCARKDIDEVHGVFRCALSLYGRDRRSGSRARVRVERPVDASRFRIERIDVSGIAAEKDTTRHDRRLRMHLNRFRNAEGPLQLERGNLSRGETRRVRRLESRVFVARTPTIPCRTGG